MHEQSLIQVSASTADPYERVRSKIASCTAQTISVPELSQLLGVKSTTLNARLRRMRTSVCTIGRTNFVGCETALKLAAVHRYALIGWPTLQQASEIIQVKPATLKAKCEKGEVEGHLDLTKRLRI